MYWNSLQFNQQLTACKAHYRTDNKWFQWGNWNRHVLSAWRLYRNAYNSSLGFIVLGGAKIRNDSILLSNLGVTSGSGVSDEEEIKLIRELERNRDELRTAPGLKNAPKVLGTGSILNDKTWTPLLNDALIIAGVHSAQEFQLSEEGLHNDAAFIKEFSKQGGGRRIDAREKWMLYMRTHPDMFWNSEIDTPRILAREMIGLMTFGYRPYFHDYQLTFLPSTAENTTFSRYLEALKESGLVSKNKKLLVTTLSNFLFQRNDAI